MIVFFFFFQAEDGIRDLVRSRGLGDVYKRQVLDILTPFNSISGIMFLAISNACCCVIMSFSIKILFLSLIHI